MVIKIDHKSPARIAFNLVGADFISKGIKAKSKRPSVQLAAGAETLEPVISANHVRLFITPMTISKVYEEVKSVVSKVEDKLVNEKLINDKLRPIEAATNRFYKSSGLISKTENLSVNLPNLDVTDGESDRARILAAMSESEQLRFLGAERRHGKLNLAVNDSKADNQFENRLSMIKMTQPELFEPYEPGSKQNDIVRNPDNNHSHVKNSKQDSRNPNASDKKEQSISEYSEKTSPTPESHKASRNSRGNPNLHKVSGHVQLAPGANAAMLPGYNLEVFWQNEGVIRNIGKVQADWTYELEVEELMGLVTAKLYDEKGVEVASGGYRLSKYETPEKLLKAHLALKNRRQIVSSYEPRAPGPKKVGVLNGSNGNVGEIENNQKYNSMAFTEGSVSALRMSGKDYYPVLNYARAGEETSFKMLTKKTVRAYFDIIRDESLTSQVPENGSLVWGKALLDGKPVSGVSIEIEGVKDHSILYFNNAFGAFYLPNRDLKSTTENGLFTIAHLPRGLYALKAFRGNQYFGHAMVEVDEGVMSPITIESTHLKYWAHVKSYDAFTGEAVPSTVHFQSTEKSVEVNGYHRIAFPANQQMAHFFAENQVIRDSQNQESKYIPTQGIYFNNDEQILIPKIQREWVYHLARQTRLQYSEGTGIIFGFSQNQIERIDLPHELGNHTQALFFDQNGNWTEKHLPGGGFLLLNVSPGNQAVVIHWEGQEILTSLLTIVDPGVASVVQPGF